ncbi:microsomal glutathione S-transferase 1-like isoform X1 [Bradysia coprophila]|uniref:microsomal glutathione S-transferase 1-like isoform X1 n=1 Tax=Bradysia coprophila TaxID=38358 RepID=UPI00187D9583|nr:microsomal glutathione S-transferase 1-like isoform X1 [Bradysia coprophila]
MLKTYELIDRSNSVFCSFIVCSAILVLKMLVMSTLTSIQRFRTQLVKWFGCNGENKNRNSNPVTSTFSAPEDVVFSEGAEVNFNNENINRVRRAHRNDMENILPYLTIGLLYVLTDPLPWLAKSCFLIATIARLLHTFVYAVYVIPQPARAICFFVQWFITIYFAIATIVFFIPYF